MFIYSPDGHRTVRGQFADSSLTPIANNYHLDVDMKLILIDNHSQRNAVPNLRPQGRYFGRKPSLFRLKERTL